MQFRVRDREAIANGELTATFRRWRSPQARVGGRYRLGPIVIEVTAVDQIDPSEISVADARAAGHDSPAAVLEAIHRNQRKSADPSAPLYRVSFICLGEQPDPRSILAAEAGLDSEELTDITARLAKMDSRARHGAWTRTTLAAISATPGRRAAELAAAQGRETQKFKTDVRKLKALGLTVSLEVGYELSPRGRVVLDALQSASSND
ncbi:MAG: hypothetical protein F4W96_09545 [Chloroflexi bacterium]|nr:hypothetical protein [Chloroflexota bacterium]